MDRDGENRQGPWEGESHRIHRETLLLASLGLVTEFLGILFLAATVRVVPWPRGLAPLCFGQTCSLSPTSDCIHLPTGSQAPQVSYKAMKAAMKVEACSCQLM